MERFWCRSPWCLVLGKNHLRSFFFFLILSLLSSFGLRWEQGRSRRSFWQSVRMGLAWNANRKDSMVKERAERAVFLYILTGSCGCLLALA